MRQRGRRVHATRRLKADSAGGRAFLAIFTLITIGLLAGGAYVAQDMHRFRTIATRTTGEVIELEYRRSSDGGSYYPIVQWQTPRGQIRQFTGSFGTSPSAYDVGEQVEVLYDPQNPKDTRLGGILGWGLVAILLAMGCIFGFVTWMIATSPARERKQREWLRRYGRPVRAELVEGMDVVPQEAQRLLEKMPSLQARMEQAAADNTLLAARWRDPQSGKEHLFHFDEVTSEQRNAYREAGHVEVLIDLKKPHIYMLRN